MTRILLYSSEPILAQGLSSVLAGNIDLRLVGVSHSTDTLGSTLETERPDILLLDLMIRLMHGLDVIHLVTSDQEVVGTNFAEFVERVAISEYWVKNHSPSEYGGPHRSFRPVSA